VGCIKKVKNKIVKERKWHILKEKFLRLEEIKEERIIKHQLQQCILVLTVVLRYNITEFVKNAELTEGNKQ
jgi:hypothetical protein|tara:strand:- start:569 stop:781 length:213 start_codon:yes stop_codon:yes gene_type:complete